MRKGPAKSFTSDDIDFIAKQYNSLARRIVEPYDSAINVMVNIATFAARSSENILNVGLGSGELAAKLLKRFPDARIIGIDPVPQFVKVAKQRFVLEPGKVELSVASLTEIGAENEFDIALAFLQIHRLSQDDKEQTMKRICRALRPGGLFLDCDYAEPDAPDIRELFKRMRYKFLELNNLNVRRRPSDEALVKHIINDQTGTTVNATLDMLKDAGFHDASIPWRHLNYVLFTACKPHH